MKKDISAYRHKGEIILIGYFNARTANNQSLCLSNEEGIGDNPLWFEEEGNQKWERISQDEKGVVTQYGVELLGVYNLYDLIIGNGLKACPSLRNITCHTCNSQILVEYVMISKKLITSFIDIEVKDCPIETNLDHNPIYVKIIIQKDNQK